MYKIFSHLFTENLDSPEKTSNVQFVNGLLFQYTNQHQIVIYSPNVLFCDPSKLRRVDGKSDRGYFGIVIGENAVIP